jgi:hypothetical protein
MASRLLPVTESSFGGWEKFFGEENADGTVFLNNGSATFLKVKKVNKFKIY